VDLRVLLERHGSYPVIEAAGLLPLKLFEHIGTVYHRLEHVADVGFAAMAELRLAVLVHEESPDSLPGILTAAGFRDFAPTVVGVIGGFGELWKATADHDVAEYVVTQRAHLASLLLFELAHEGRAIPAMRRAAELGGLHHDFERWLERLPTAR
jgi:hypothetical protein